MSSMSPVSMQTISAWPNLLLSWRKAAKGKRSADAAAGFEHKLADQLLALQHELVAGSYSPGEYTHFYIHEPKRRLISAAPFRDRVVHHAICNIIEPVFEQQFIADSYANRISKGTHRAINRFQHFARHNNYVLRMDIVKHFPAIDHGVLLNILAHSIKDQQVLGLIKVILNSGESILDQEYQAGLIPGDDLLSLCRPHGLPIGNLTSQFWSNCYMHPLDIFIKRELSCQAYLRYVDDFALFANNKAILWKWKQAIKDKLCELRLRIHENSAQVTPVKSGIPWLGFIIYPQYRRVKRRKVVHAIRRLTERFEQWRNGHISFAEFDSSVQGWINHVRYADSWGLREHVLSRFTW